jgi:hypothetical protein
MRRLPSFPASIASVGNLLALALLLSPTAADACASCSAGGLSPLVLYPNEQLKTFVGMSVTGEQERIMRDGTSGGATGPRRREALTIAVGYAPRRWLSLAASIPYLNNRADDGTTRAASGDPLLEARLTAVQAAWDRPLVPQVQAIAAYKDAQSRSIYDTEEPFTLVDVFGNGYDEVSAGADVWWGMATVMPGVAHVVTRALPRQQDGMRLERGVRQTTTISIGARPIANLHTTVGLVRDVKREERIDGEAVARSDSRQHNGYVSARYNPAPGDEIRVTYTRSAVAFNNAETTRGNAVAVGYARTL